MSSSNLNVLRQLAAASDVPAFLRLASSKACVVLICQHPEDEFRRLQRKEYSALVFAALFKGLQLCTCAAAAAGQCDRRPADAASKDLQRLIDWLGSLALAANDILAGCSKMWGKGAQEVNNMEQKLFDSGVLPLMQQTWRQLAAHMEQQQQHLQQQLQQPDSPQQPDSTAPLHLAHCATLAGSLLLLWAHCLKHKKKGDEQPSELTAAVGSAAFLADVATGIAAVWRSDAALQQWHNASGDAAAAAAPPTQSTASVRICEARAATAQGVYRSQGQLAGLQVGEHAARLMGLAVEHSLVAASILNQLLFQPSQKHPGKQLSGSGGAHDLQWVMLVYTALLTGELHQQQQGMTAVQLHKARRATACHSSSQQEESGNSGGAGSSSSSTEGNSNAGSSRTSTGRNTPRTPQASSSSAAASSLHHPQQGSMVPPYHLQVLRAAGVPSLRLKDPDAVGHWDTNPQHVFIPNGLVPSAVWVLHILLPELKTHLKLQLDNAAAAAAPAQVTAGTSSSSSNSHSSTSSSLAGSSTSDCSSAASSNSAGGAAAAAVLALLSPCSLMWGEVLALFAGAGSGTACLPAFTTTIEHVWHVSMQIARQQASAAQDSQLSAQTGVQHAPGEPRPQDVRIQLCTLQLVACFDSWYRSCVELIVPSLLHMRAVGALSSTCYAALDVMLSARVTAVANGLLLKPSLLPQALLPTFAIFSNPAASIPSLEAAVRHNWGASTAPGEDSTGLKLACIIILALTQTLKPPAPVVWEALLLEERSALLHHARSSRRSPALLSLLLSCMKQLQHSCQQHPQGALKVAGLAGMAGELAGRLLRELLGSGAVGALPVRFTSSTAAPSGSSPTAGQGHSTPSVPSAAETAHSMVADPQPQATTGCDIPAGQPAPAVSSTGGIASTWLVLLGRVLYTAGAALQAVAADTEPHPDASSIQSVGTIPTPTTATSLLNGFQQCLALACEYSESACADVGSGTQSVQVLLPCGAAASSALQAQQTLGLLLDAAAQHAKQLEEAAGISSSVGDPSMGLAAVGQQHSSTINSVGIWRQVLGSEQGRKLPQALMDVGSLLCAALPSRFCCNEPSCCCLDKPSELQLAAGKGTKCSGCGVARYCSVAHQRLHWKQHKPACKAIAAAAAAAAATAVTVAGASK